jgi:hypothetical protein
VVAEPNTSSRLTFRCLHNWHIAGLNSFMLIIGIIV